MAVDRRTLLRMASGGALAAGLATPLARTVAQTAAPATPPPILFVHGNGDHAAFWQTILWRFESNGYSRDRLFAFNFTDPTARDLDAQPQPNRSSSEDQLREITFWIDRVLGQTGARQVALVGSSRGGNAIRNYLTQEGVAAKISHAVLCGTPNHGVFDWEATRGNEFNGKGPFLSRLNALPGEVTPGPAWATIRSDSMDKYAQPDGRYLGRPGTPTGVTFEGPELKGAANLVLPGLDHREVAFHPRAFREQFRFIAGREPARLDVAREPDVRIEGLVTGLAGATPTNRPVADAAVEVYAVAPDTGERRGAALWSARTGPAGAWGPVTVPTDAPLEFVVAAPGQPITHIYRSGFPRSSALVHLRPGRALNAAEQGGGAVLLFSRPRGYFGLPRDVVLVDGKEPGDLQRGVPADATATLRLGEETPRPVACLFNEERVVARPWPARDNHLTIAELTY